MSDDEDVVMQIDHDDDTGAPIMLAVRKPGQVAAQPDASGAVLYRGAQSGNPNFDPITGKFAGKKLRNLQVVAQTVQQGAPSFQSGVPAGVDPLVWERRMDAVRDAARQDKMMTAARAAKFLTGRVADVTKVDINMFLADVMNQRITDVADALDFQNKPRRDRPEVKVSAPAGWIRRVMSELNPPQTLLLVKRLEGRGWDSADINRIVVSKIRDPEKKKALQQLYGEPEPEEGKEEK